MNSVILSKISAPKPTASLISRKRLLDRLWENNDKRFILLTSPAGYGKTTLVLDYLNSSQKKYAWLSLTENVSHIYSFYKYMISAIQNVETAFGNNSLALLESLLERNKLSQNVTASIRDMTNVITEELNLCSINNFVLVLDDFHHINDSGWKDAAIDSLIKNFHPGIQLIVTTRQIPELDFAYYMDNDLMFKIEMEQLVFSESEISELISGTYNLTATPEKIKEISSKLKGWVTGLHLMLQGSGKDINTIDLEDQLIPENIFNTLADRIFENQGRDIQELLLQTSIIENFHRELCEDALGFERFDDKINSIIGNLPLLYEIPITFEDGTKVISYNYVQLLNNYLRARLYEDKSINNINDIYRKAYHFYLDKKDIVTAVNYMVEAKDDEMALCIINDNFTALLNDGKIEFLWNWFTRIDKDLIDKDAQSLLNFGMINKHYTGDLKSTLEIIEKVEEMLSSDSDKTLIMNVYSNKALLLISLGRSSEIIKEFSELLNNEKDPVLNASYKYYLAYALFHTSEYTKSQEILNDLVGLENCFTGKKLIVNINKVLGHINLIRGNYLSALKYYDVVVNEQRNIFDRIEVLCNMVLLSSQTGEYNKAEKLLSELDIYIERYPTPILTIPYLMARQAFYFECGDYEKALNTMMDIKRKAEDLNNMIYLYLSERLITECYYYKKDMTSALEFYELSKQHIDKTNILKQIELNVSGALIMGKEQEKIFLDAYDYYTANSLNYNLAQICYYLSALYFRSGDSGNLEKYLNECIAVCKENGYSSFLIREYINDQELIETLPEDEFIRNIKLKAKDRINKLCELI